MVHYLKFFSKNERPIDFEKNLAYGQRVSSLLDGKFDVEIESESCFYVILSGQTPLEEFRDKYLEKLTWLLSHNVFDPHLAESTTFPNSSNFILEIGPR